MFGIKVVEATRKLAELSSGEDRCRRVFHPPLEQRAIVDHVQRGQLLGFKIGGSRIFVATDCDTHTIALQRLQICAQHFQRSRGQRCLRTVRGQAGQQFHNSANRRHHGDTRACGAPCIIVGKLVAREWFVIAWVVAFGTKARQVIDLVDTGGDRIPKILRRFNVRAYTFARGMCTTDNFRKQCRIESAPIAIG